MTPYYSDNLVTLYHGDCREVLPRLDPGSIDLVLADPPYGIDGAVVRKNATLIEDWSDAEHNVLCDSRWRYAAVRTLDQTGAYFAEFFGGFARLDATLAETRGCALIPWRFYSLVKTAPPPTPRPTMMSGIELALVSFVGKRPWHGGQHPDRWIGLTPNRLGQGVHPTQKPLGCIRAMIRALAPVGGAVCDPFVGSGTTLIAARDLRCRPIGIEIEERYCEIAARRLSQGVLDFGVGVSRSQGREAC